MTKKIIFRADGNSSTGLGHLYRLFSLVEVVKGFYDFVFLVHESSTYSVIPRSYKKKVIPLDVCLKDEVKWLVKNFSSKEYIIIADGYHFVSSYQKQLKNEGYKLLYIDDLGKEHMYADIVINHSPYIQEKQYFKEEYTKISLGTKFALLRPSYLLEAKQDRIIKNIDSVFICFGGADPYNLTVKAIQGVLRIPRIKEVHVVIGGAYLNEKGIIELEKKFSSQLFYYKNLSENELLEVMKKCNSAIVPASTILYEVCCVKMPVLSGYYVDNQELIYKGFLNENAIYKGGSFKEYTFLDFTNALQGILKEKNYDFQIEAQKRMFDTKIAQRHLDLIKKLC